MSFKKVLEFENEIAKFFGAPYAVAVDCCTHGLELSLRHTKAEHIEVPVRTYLSVPMLADKLNITRSWTEKPWQDYYYLTNRVIDAAVLWKPNSYVPGTLMCVSFQFKKHLSLGRGGVILLDNCHSKEILKKMSYDGRTPDIPWAKQDINMMGYHYYMTPETAEMGLQKLPLAVKSEPKKWNYTDWVDLRNMSFFKESVNG